MPTVISLFSGAGGLDLGFIKSGYDIVLANDINVDAVNTYKTNIGNHIILGDVKTIVNTLAYHKGVDSIIGGPPCQGFSVAGKMDPDDKRSMMIWEFAKAIDIVKPKVFAMENVKALATLSKWNSVKNNLIEYFNHLGYSVGYIVLNATEYNVPQSRERVIFIGLRNTKSNIPDLNILFSHIKSKSKTVRETLSILDYAGTGNNKSICRAKITLAENPILRKSPYAGMLFNGLGRPVRIDGYCSTLPASMGGNKTPIIDTDELYLGKKSWVEKYHSDLIAGKKPQFGPAPLRLRRLTVEEASILQTFPENYKFHGSQSSKYTQIGNAVPPELATSVAKVLHWFLENDRYKGDYPVLSQHLQFRLHHVN